MASYFLGIDGGGTSCRMRLTDNTGILLGESQAGAANLYLGADVVLPHIQHCLTEILEQAGLTPNIYPQTYAVGGIAGTEAISDYQWLLDYFADFADFRCVSDCETACLGAFGGADGALLISGTGSIGWAISQGKNYRVGGWGFNVSDKYSGAWMGHQALFHTLDAHDGLCHSTLCTVLLNHFDNNPSTIVDWATSATPADYGQFAPYVIDHAEQGDTIATTIIQQAGQGMGTMADHLLQKSGCNQWCFVGGLAQALTPYLPTAIAKKRQTPKGDALEGALIIARRLQRG